MELPGGCRDEPVPEAEVPDLRRGVACPSATASWDASDAVPRASQPDAEGHRAPAGVDAGKLVALAPGGREPDALCPQPEHRLAMQEPPVSEGEPCTRASAQFVARSCAATEAAEQPARADEARPEFALKLEVERPNVERPNVEGPTQAPEARPTRPATQSVRLAPQVARTEPRPPESPEAQPLAFPPARAEQGAAELPAMPLTVRKVLSQVRQALWPPGAVAPRAC
jgi:hypothetical protein